MEWGGKEVLRVYPEGSHPDGDSVRPSTKGNSDPAAGSSNSRGAPDRDSGDTTEPCDEPADDAELLVSPFRSCC